LSVGMTDNLFYFILYLGNLLHSFKNKDAFSNPYEHSLMYSFSFGLLLLNYSKMYETITSLNLYNSSIEIFGLLFFLCCISIEPFLINSEISLFKLCVRMSLSLVCLFLYFVCQFPTNEYIFLYSFGYMLCSTIVQYICLNKKINKLEEHPDCNSIKEKKVDHKN